jgi:hypothetical protein
VWLLLISLVLVWLVLLYKRNKLRGLTFKNVNPPKKSLPKGTYLIEAYCLDKNKKLFFITLNYASWEEACRARNDIVEKNSLEINYNNKAHSYTVWSTKIRQVGLHDK